MRRVLALAVVCVCAAMPARSDNFLILPFFNLTGDSGLDWIGESVGETIREALASKGILALDREARLEAYRRLSIRPYSQLTKATVMRLAELLDADQVVFGTFDVTGAEPGTRSRGTLRLAAQIINMKEISRGPQYTEMGPLEDMARLQTQLAWDAVQLVLGARAPSQSEFLGSQPPLRIEAIESYTRGLLAPTPDQQFRLFTQAVRVEPRYSQANYHLGRLLYARKSYKLAADHLSRVAPAGVYSRTATFFLGLCAYRTGDFPAAERAFRTVAEEVPLNEVWNNLGAALSRIGSPAALENFAKAIEGDDTDPDYHFNAGYALFRRGDLAGAAERFRAVLDRDPDDAEAITMLGRCLKKAPAARPGRSEGLERLKESYEESAYLQLKAVVEGKR